MVLNALGFVDRQSTHIIVVAQLCYLVVAIVNSIESTHIIVVTQLLRNTARESGLSKSTLIIVVTQHSEVKQGWFERKGSTHITVVTRTCYL